MRVVHVLDHSIPTQSGYAFRTLAILKEQRALGWETFHLSGPRQGLTEATEEHVDGWHFYRTSSPGGILEDIAGFAEIELMGEIAHRIEQVARVGGLRELIRPGETATLFKPGDPESLTAAARRYVETERNWKTSVARYADAYACVPQAHQRA